MAWHDAEVNPAVLIPRPETEELVDIIVKDNTKSDLKVLDVCTGSGCIAVALARSLDFPEVSGFDISDDALAVARENASALKVDVNFSRPMPLISPKWKMSLTSLSRILPMCLKVKKQE